MTITRSNATLALFAAAVLGCRDTSAPPEVPPLEFAVAPTVQWSGGTVRVTSASLRGAVPPAVIAGRDTLEVARLDDTTLAVRLPAMPSGRIGLRLEVGREAWPLDSVTIVGAHGFRSVQPGIYADQLVALSLGTSGLTVFGEQDGEAASLRVTGDVVVRYPGLDSPESGRGLGTTPVPGRFVVAESTGALAVWQLWPTPERIVPVPWCSAPCGRHLAQLSDEVWGQALHHDVWLRDPDPVSRLAAEETRVFQVSPSGDRGTTQGNGQPDGTAVFDPRTGEVVYRTGFFRSWAVAFRDDGARLYMGGYSLDDFALRIQALDAADGTVLADVALPDAPFAALYDGALDLLYVGLEERVSETVARPVILVLDPETLETRGTLVPSADAASCPLEGCWNTVLGIDFPSRRLYAVKGRYAGAGTLIWSFDRLAP